MAKFVEINNKMINADIIAKTGFYDNTMDSETAGCSIIFIYLREPIQNKDVIKFEYLGKEQREKARVDYENLKKDLKNS